MIKFLKEIKRINSIFKNKYYKYKRENAIKNKQLPFYEKAEVGISDLDLIQLGFQVTVDKLYGNREIICPVCYSNDIKRDLFVAESYHCCNCLYSSNKFKSIKELIK